MDRRNFIVSGAALLAAGSRAEAYKESSDSLEMILSQLDANPSIVDRALAFQEKTVARGVGHGLTLNRPISDRAIYTIKCFEISSERVYNHRYQVPVFPGLGSGATIGIGYDLRFASYADLDRDWKTRLPAEDISRLVPFLGKPGPQSFSHIPELSNLKVSWEKATEQFAAFLPYEAYSTASTFHHTDELHPDSFGALVSLIYNRGTNTNPNADRRREMYNIQKLADARNWDAVPGQIRSMKRLWLNQKGGDGLVLRREAEALLFEQGRKKSV